jgi:hypothetical protein
MFSVDFVSEYDNAELFGHYLYDQPEPKYSEVAHKRNLPSVKSAYEIELESKLEEYDKELRLRNVREQLKGQHVLASSLKQTSVGTLMRESHRRKSLTAAEDGVKRLRNCLSEVDSCDHTDRDCFLCKSKHLSECSHNDRTEFPCNQCFGKFHIKSENVAPPLRDQRSTNDRLTDYLLAKAFPSEDLLDGTKEVSQQHIHCFEDGEGGAAGFPKRTKNTLADWRTPDDSPFIHRNSVLTDFFELGGYRCFPDAVMVELQIKDLIDVNAKDCSYTVDFNLITRWYDRSFDTLEYRNKLNVMVYAKTIPHLSLGGVDYSFDGVQIPTDEVEEQGHEGEVRLRKGSDPPGVLYHSRRIQVKLRDVSELFYFPFDTQQLELTFRLPGSDDPSDLDFGRVLIPVRVSMLLDCEPTDWMVYPATCLSGAPRGDKQKIVATLHIKREPRYFEVNIFVALFLITSLVFGIFCLPAVDLGSRMEAGLANLLNTVAYKWFISERLPSVPYMTVLDIYIYWCMLMSVIVLSESMLLQSFHCVIGPDGEEWECDLENMHAFERAFAWGLLRYWLVFNIAYFALSLVHREFFSEHVMKTTYARYRYDNEAGSGYGALPPLAASPP